MKKKLGLMAILVCLFSAPFGAVSALPSFYCGPPPSVATSGIPRDVSIWWPMGPHMTEEEAEWLHQLADQGIKINYRLYWWEEPGIAYHNALDIFYNESFRADVEQVIDYNFDMLDPEKVWAVTLSDEEPSWSFHDWWGTGSFPWVINKDVAKYSDIYSAETGFQLKSFNDMNGTEGVVFIEWVNEKTVWVFNHLYDYVKSKWPHLLVFQFMFMAPFLPYELCAPYELKADGYFVDFFTCGFNPWGLYETIRRYKTTLPDKEFHIVLWGTIWDFFNEAGDKLYYKEGSFEQIRRDAWVAYLAGTDAIGWFTWGPQDDYGYDWRWEVDRTDLQGRQLYMYTNRLNRELAKLPVLQPEPQVLAVGGEFHLKAPSYFAGTPELELFSEYDTVNHRFFAKNEMDLSKYRLIVVAEWRYYEETVRKLNEYVAAGGNVLFLGGTGWESNNIYGNATRTTRFLIEENAVQSTTGGHVQINISQPNLLDLELDYEGYFHQTMGLQLEQLNENYYPIGDFFLIEEDGTPRKLEDTPLVLYHDTSNPRSGWILYWGAMRSSRIPGVTWETYGESQEVEKYQAIRFLNQEVASAFANFLNLSSSISTKDNENILITQATLEGEPVVLAGLSNFNPERRSITYSLDLDHFDLPAGEYWVHSLDENAPVGQFESNASKLELAVEVPANSTKLFLISQEKPEPLYSVEIFPKIPSAEDLPSASFTYSPSEPSVADRVNFIDTSTDSDGSIVFWHWDFGDGRISTERNPTYQYPDQGEFTIRLTVTDNDGGITTIEQTITVTPMVVVEISFIQGFSLKIGLLATLALIILGKRRRML